MKAQSKPTAPWRRLIAPGIATLVALAILISLGVWQIHRLHWKEALIARVTAGVNAAPIAAPGPVAWSGLDLSALQYTPVTVHGRYHNDEEVHVAYSLTEPRGPVGGLGYVIMTPFETDAGWLVYVNRGFVPQPMVDPASRAKGQIEGETTVVGLLREPYDRPWFIPGGDNAAKNEWLSRDPAAYAKAYGLPASQVAPYIIDAKFDPNLPGGLPQGGETILSFPNNHLQYVITWFGLAAVLLAIFIVFAMGKLRPSGQEER